LLYKQRFQAATGRFPSYTRTGNATSHYHNIKGMALALKLFEQ
jgi:hypothetical protein